MDARIHAKASHGFSVKMQRVEFETFDTVTITVTDQYGFTQELVVFLDCDQQIEQLPTDTDKMEAA